MRNRATVQSRTVVRCCGRLFVLRACPLRDREPASEPRVCRPRLSSSATNMIFIERGFDGRGFELSEFGW